jgi:hypothetical protein
MKFKLAAAAIVEFNVSVELDTNGVAVYAEEG